MKRARDIIWWLATFYILWRGFVILGEAADHNIYIQLLEALIYISVGVFGVWTNAKVNDHAK